VRGRGAASFERLLELSSSGTNQPIEKMPTTKTTTSSSQSSTSTSSPAAAKPRAKTRQPPVAERLAVGTAVAVPALQGTSPAPASPPATSGNAIVAGNATAPGVSAATSGTGSGSSSGTVESPVGAPPAVTIPSVPAGFVPVSAADLRGFHFLASQIAAVPEAIQDLQAFSDYTAVFGITAPDVEQVIQLVSVAYEWTILLSQTAAFYAYTRSQQAVARKGALVVLDALKPSFDLATTANPALVGEYPGLARLLGAKGLVAKRAAVSRAKNKKTEAPAAAAGSGAGSTPTATAPQAGSQAPAGASAPAAGAAGGATPATAGPTRIVTVQD
jgi:hypothetical protein